MTTTETGRETTTEAQTATRKPPGHVVSIVGIVLGVLALLFGIIAGIPGLICGVVGTAKGNRLGWWAIGLSIVCSIAGYFIGIALIGGHHR